MAKNPADQFYWGDWLNDTALQSASTAARGVWINMLCRMWFAPTKGEISGTQETLAKLCNADCNDFVTFLNDAKTHNFAEVVTGTCNGFVTVRNRRMYRKALDQKNTYLRVKKHRTRKQCNGVVTDPCNGIVTDASSILPITKVIKETVTLPDWIEPGLWNDFKDHRKKLRKPMTLKAEKIIIKKLEYLKDQGHNPRHLLITAIERGWQSVFAPKEI